MHKRFLVPRQSEKMTTYTTSGYQGWWANLLVGKLRFTYAWAARYNSALVWGSFTDRAFNTCIFSSSIFFLQNPTHHFLLPTFRGVYCGCSAVSQYFDCTVNLGIYVRVCVCVWPSIPVAFLRGRDQNKQRHTPPHVGQKQAPSFQLYSTILCKLATWSLKLGEIW